MFCDFSSVSLSLYKWPWPSSSYLAVQSKLEPCQHSEFIVQPEPGTASGRPVPVHCLRDRRLQTAYANVHMFMTVLGCGSSGYPAATQSYVIQYQSKPNRFHWDWKSTLRDTLFCPLRYLHTFSHRVRLCIFNQHF